MTSIRLHEKYGVNPTMTQCFICGEAKDILLVGNNTRQFKEHGVDVKDDGEMPMNIGCIDKEPCGKCKEYMQQGIILISVRDGEGGDNPYRTGHFVVVKENALDNICNDDTLLQDIKKKRMAFIEDAIWRKIGLP